MKTFKIGDKIVSTQNGVAGTIGDVLTYEGTNTYVVTWDDGTSSRTAPINLQPAMASQNINMYFYTKLHTQTGDASFDELPLDSNCGRDCQKAIDAAAAFIRHLRAAIGAGSTTESNIVEACLLVCQVYWRG